MESWRSVWRWGIVPQVTAKHLEPLFEALRDDDIRLLQGATTSPPVMQCVQNWPVEAADAIGFMGWRGADLDTVGEVEEFFARMCFEIDQLIGEPAACRRFLNWFDETPREKMRRELLAEVWRSLALAYCVEWGIVCPIPDAPQWALSDWLADHRIDHPPVEIVHA